MSGNAVSADLTARGVRLAITAASGAGTGPTELAAFDAALRDAGVANFNLITLSSVIPAGSTVSVAHPGASRVQGAWGDRLYVVMAQCRVSRPGREAWAGIGWVQDESGKGLFVEHEGHSESEVEADIHASLAALCEGRAEPFGPHEILLRGTRCTGEPVCAVVVAAFTARPWSEGVGDHDAEHSGRSGGARAMSRERATAGFERFSPHDYLAEYYGRIGSENERLLAFLVEAYADVPVGCSMLEFGAGPTIYQLVSAARRVGYIDVADHLALNLATIDAWRRGAPDAVDWSAYVRRTLELEGRSAGDDDVAAREELLRRRIARLLVCDAFAPDPLLGHGRTYDVVGVNFVAESITPDRVAWRAALANVAGLVGPGGRLVVSALEGAEFWKVGERTYPAVPVTLDDLVGTLGELGFETRSAERADAEVIDLTADGFAGYTGLIFVSATR